MEQRVVCAANKLSDGTIILGARHWDQFMHLSANRVKALFDASDEAAERYFAKAEQGFIDQFGNFLTRKEAYVIAEKNNQIVRSIGYETDKLYSEHLY